jgi:beta-glucosidase
MDPAQPIETRIKALLDQMTLTEKVGQTIQLERSQANTLNYVQQYYLGSVLSGGGSVPNPNSPEGWLAMIEGYQDKAALTPLGIPVLYEIDAVHGTAHMPGTTIFPHNIGMGATQDEELAEKVGAAVAEEMRALDLHVSFAPAMTAAQNIRYGRTHEGWGADAVYNGVMAAATARGFQGGKPADYTALNTDAEHPNQYAFLGDGRHVGATMKHYFGEGITVNGVNQGNAVIPDLPFTEAELKALTPAELLANETIQYLLEPYRILAESGARSIMPSYNSINGLKMHEQVAMINLVKLPKDQGGLGFTGFVVSDYNAHTNGITGADQKERNADVFNAGIDLAMVVSQNECTSATGWFQTIKAGVLDGTIPMSRLDDAVTRILRVKFELGLFENPKPDTTELQATIRNEEHLALARQAVRESMVLLKNDGDVVGKLKDVPGEKILVAGRFADNIGYQVGSWTLSWQGGGATNHNNYKGETLLEAVRAVKGDAVAYNVSAERNEGDENDYDVVIIGIGETPYAEGSGDAGVTAATPRGTLQIGYSDWKAIQNAKANYPGAKIVAVAFFGRPMVVTNVLDDLDGLVCAWWPGTEGLGMTDVLFGDYDFTGVTLFAWPWYSEWAGDAGKPVLWPVGYGLKKGQEGEIPEAPERQGDPIEISAAGTTSIPGLIYSYSTQTGVRTEGQPVHGKSGYISSTTLLTPSAGTPNATDTQSRFNEQDTWVEWKISVPLTSVYDIGFTSARSGAAAEDAVTLSVDGEARAVYAAQANIPAQPVELTKGEHLLRLTFAENATALRIDSVNITSQGGAASMAADVPSVVAGFDANVAITANLPDGTQVKAAKGGQEIASGAFAGGSWGFHVPKAAVAEAGQIEVLAYDAEGAIVGGAAVAVVPYDPSVWHVSVENRSNSVVATFNAQVDISDASFDVLADGVPIPGASASSVDEGGRSFIIQGAQIDFLHGAKIEIRGVRLPALFPDYLFTYQAAVD